MVKKIVVSSSLILFMGLLIISYQNFANPVVHPRFTPLAEVDSYEYLLPLWLDQERIHIHIPQSGYSYRDREKYFGASQALKSLGFNAYTRHIKPMSHGPMWPTQISSTTSKFDLENGTPANDQFYARFITNLNHLSPDTCLIKEHDDFDEDFSKAIQSGAYPRTDCRDLALRTQLTADKNGINMIGYYWLGADEPLRKEYPELSALEPVPSEEWLQNLAPLDTNSLRGVPMQAVDVQQMKNQSPQRAFRLSFETEYKTILIERIKEVVARGIKTIYLDHLHGSQNGDWRFFKDKDFGEHPMPIKKDITDPKYRALLKRFNDNNVEVLNTLIETGKKYYQDFSAIASVSYLPVLFDPRSRSDLASRTPVVKTEFHLPHRLINFYHRRYFDYKRMPSHSDILDFGYAIISGASYGRPFSAWIHDPAQNINPDRVHDWSETNILSQQQIESASAFVIGSGGIANLHLPSIQDSKGIYSQTFNDPRYLNVLKFKDASKRLGRFRPLKWTAVYYSEQARDQLYDQMFTPPKQSLEDTYSKAWDEIFNPTLRAFRTFRKRGMPVNIITDVQVEKRQLQDYHYIIVPIARNRIPLHLMNHLNEFSDKVIFIQDSTEHSSSYTGDFKESDLLQAAPFKEEAPFRTGYLQNLRVSYFINPRGRIIVTTYQDIDWLLNKCVNESSDALQNCREEKAKVSISPKNFILYKNQNTLSHLSLYSSNLVDTKSTMIQDKERIEILNLMSLGLIEFR